MLALIVKASTCRVTNSRQSLVLALPRLFVAGDKSIKDGEWVQDLCEFVLRCIGPVVITDRDEQRDRLAVDTLGRLLALHVIPANEQDRAPVEQLAHAIEKMAGQSVALAYVDQCYTGEAARQAAQSPGIEQEVVKHTGAKRGFVLLPRRWVVQRSFAWAARFRRLARDSERLPHTLAGFHFLAFACLTLPKIIDFIHTGS
ncbi:hypothetical protein FCJ57_02540 [Burkholderia diffusa]|nr:hypothetical protein [Burkholderia diffusa]